jgi:hypothetical protein
MRIPVIELETVYGDRIIIPLRHIKCIFEKDDNVSLIFNSDSPEEHDAWNVKANFDDLKAAIERGESCNMKPTKGTP